MQTRWQDRRYSLRQLVNNPGFTLTAIASLALGIGATSAVFSVIYAALMNPFPYPAADRIVRLGARDKFGAVRGVSLNSPQIQALRQSPAIESLVAMDFWSMTLTGHDLPQNVEAVYLSSNFSFLGVPPLLGRGLVPSDAVDGDDPQPVAVLSYKFWRGHFNANPAVLSQTLQLDRKNYTIVAVAPPRFTWYSGDGRRSALSRSERANQVDMTVRGAGETGEQRRPWPRPITVPRRAGARSVW